MIDPFDKPIDHLKESCIYNVADYGLSSIFSGKHVRIALLDSGKPKHQDIAEIKNDANFCDTSNSSDDVFGHATALAGIMVGKSVNNGVTGFVPDATLLSAKIMDDRGVASFNAMVGGILWAIVKHVDIIVISCGSESENPIINDAVKKAHDSGICIIAAAGNRGLRVKDIDYPAKCPESLAVGSLSRGKSMSKFSSNGNDVRVVLPGEKMISTYINNTYISISGTSVSAAVAGGLAASLIQAKRDKTNLFSPSDIYREIQQLSYI